MQHHQVSLDEGTLFLKKQGRSVAEEQEARASRFYYALVRLAEAFYRLRCSSNALLALTFL